MNSILYLLYSSYHALLGTGSWQYIKLLQKKQVILTNSTLCLSYSSLYALPWRGCWQYIKQFTKAAYTYEQYSVFVLLVMLRSEPAMFFAVFVEPADGDDPSAIFKTRKKRGFCHE